MSKNSLNGLEGKSDNVLIRMVKNDQSSEAFTEICRRYQDIFYKICHRYDNKMEQNGIHLPDIYEEMNATIFHCVNTYDKRKGARLGSWIGNFARYLCLNSMKSRRAYECVDPSDLDKKLEVKQNIDILHNEEIKNDKIQTIKDIIDKLKDEKIAKVLSLRYLSDKKMKWENIAKLLGVSLRETRALDHKGKRIVRNSLSIA